jgi:hypothetical protein
MTYTGVSLIDLAAIKNLIRLLFGGWHAAADRAAAHAIFGQSPEIPGE